MKIIDFIACVQGEVESGIIYCRTRESTEEVARCVSQKGIPAHAYHAGLSFLNLGCKVFRLP